MPGVLLLLVAYLAAPPAMYRVISPKDDGIIATGINARGDVVGFEWAEEADRPGVVGQVPFFARGKRQVTLPLLEGYTATFPAAVSDAGLVVGRVSKPAPPGERIPLRNQAFVWDEAKGIRGLGALEGDWASLACGVSADGDRISGFSIGDGRIRACVWDRDGDRWEGRALPRSGQLGTQVVPISDDGRRVAGVEDGVPCLWSLGEGGDWTREDLGAIGALVPRDVNNAGTVVGLRSTGDGLIHAVVWTRGEGCKDIEKPEGYVRSEAHAVNNRGVIVGMIDGRQGSKTGPRAFAYEGGRLHILDEGGPNFVAATAINDRGEVAGVMEKPEESEADEAQAR